MPKVAAIQMTSGRDVAANLSMASELLREASGKGAELAVLPENFAFLGVDDAERLTVVDPWGVIIAERDAGAGVIMADLDMMALQQLREQFPALQHRRQL